jgi:hypothetical protein
MSAGRLAILCVAILAVSWTVVEGQYYYSIDGVDECGYVTQLWYDGFWKEVKEFNGTVAFMPNDDVRGRIAVYLDFSGPHESRIKDAQEAGAVAVFIVRDYKFATGFGMYLVDGSDRTSLSIPVFEGRYNNKFQSGDCKTPVVRFTKVPHGTAVIIRPLPNLFKRAADSPFQLILAIILSLWQIFIITFGLFRIYQLCIISQIPFHTSGPICCLLEAIGAAIRLAYTCTDPFWAWRILPDSGSQMLITLSFPFSLTAGILLTFWWAEMLRKTKLKVTPFVSSYRNTAIFVIVLLFAIELICSSLRAFGQKLPAASSIAQISALVYCVVALTLTICYVACAYGIFQKLNQLPGNTSASTKNRNMHLFAIRVIMSAAGYIIFVCATIGFAIAFRAPWGRQLTMNLGFIGHNWAATMQVIATRPPKQTKSSYSQEMPVSSRFGSEVGSHGSSEAI